MKTKFGWKVNFKKAILVSKNDLYYCVNKYDMSFNYTSTTLPTFGCSWSVIEGHVDLLITLQLHLEVATDFGV